MAGAAYLYWASQNKQFPFNIMPPAAMVPAPMTPRMMMQMQTPSMMQPVMMMTPTGEMVLTPMPGPPVKIGGTGSTPPAIPPIMPPGTPVRKPITVPKPVTKPMPTMMPMTMAMPPAMMMPPKTMPPSTLNCAKTNPQCCGPYHKGNCHAECNFNPKGVNTPVCKQCLAVCGSYSGTRCDCATGMPR